MNVSGDQGTVRAKHKLSFDLVLLLNMIIRQLRLELKTWRKVFWRLWGICHAFVCCLCGQPFQVSPECLQQLIAYPPFSSTCWSSARTTQQSRNSQRSSSRTQLCHSASFPAVARQPLGSSPSLRSPTVLSKNLERITLFCAGWGGLQVPGSQSEGAQPKGLRDVPHPDDSQVTRQPHNELLLDRDANIRDLICATPKRKSGLLRLPGEVASVSLPSPRAESVRATKQQSSKTQNPKKATSKA